MIEIGKSFPNLTVPTVTTGAAELTALKAKYPSFGATIAAEWVGSTLFGPGPRISGLHQHRSDHDHFTAENAVGARIWLTMFSTICPSASVWARASIQAGSVMNAAHFFSRSA